MNGLLGLALVCCLISFAPVPSFAACQTSGEGSFSSGFEISGSVVTLCGKAVEVQPARSAVVVTTIQPTPVTPIKPVVPKPTTKPVAPKPVPKPAPVVSKPIAKVQPVVQIKPPVVLKIIMVDRYVPPPPKVVVPIPDIEGREKILSVHMKKVPLAPDVNGRTIARGTPGFSGADLANLVNEAALLAARRNKRLVAMQEFEDAKDKVMMGAERRSMVMTDEEKKMTAYHEAGHALVSMHEAASDPIHKATIIPRGRALGMVMRLPERDSYSYHRDKMLANLSVSMGGRVAEELVFGYDKVSSGASGDIQYATSLARNMVTKWGMSDKLGPLQYEDQQEGYLGMGGSSRMMVSDETAKLIDSEIRGLIDTAHVRASDILKAHEDTLHVLANALLEFETLSGDDIKELMNSGTLNRPDAPVGPVRPAALQGSTVPRSGKRSSGGAAPLGA